MDGWGMGREGPDLIRDDTVRLGIVQCWHSEASCVFRVYVKVDVAQMRETWVNWVGADIVPRKGFV